MASFRTRLAPSPTGSMHLGNARTFLVAWWMARHAGGEVVLRLEDLDRARVKPGLVERVIEDLRWLGLDWDEGPILQSERLALYDAALRRLIEAGHCYPCVCSRKEIRAAVNAPHAEDEESVYPGTCRGRFASWEEARAFKGRPPACRFRVPQGEIAFDDRFLGRVALDPARAGGDFVVRSVDGAFAYQLAVTVDDAAMGISEVVRGDDLVASTPRQILLYHALGHRAPRFTHLPLVLDESGARMAKRRGDTEIAFLRARGIDPREVIALLARSSGFPEAGAAVSAADLIERFDLARLPREAARLSPLPWAAAR
ncbi:MAG: tRNA glutamyl-Q(34) synthetase GluQRS [Planctomycetes bacterium]|nr:tRNA glutamyl-Q(34) synthetase GluQRS [Planctomycetota bacterium]